MSSATLENIANRETTYPNRAEDFGKDSAKFAAAVKNYVDTEVAGAGGGEYSSYTTLNSPADVVAVVGTSYLIVGGGSIRLPLASVSTDGDTIQAVSADNLIEVRVAIGDPVVNLRRVSDGGGQDLTKETSFGEIKAVFRNGKWYATSGGA